MQFWSRVSVSYSNALLNGDSHGVDPAVIRPNNDLTVQITSRKEKISFLIKFINENGVLGKVGVLFVVPSGLGFKVTVQMSQRSRQRLATDAEKLYAAQQLWLRLNETILYVKQFILGSVTYNALQTRASVRHLK